MNVSILLASVSIALLLIYAADLGINISTHDSLFGISGLQRGIILGGPALVLPIIASFISKNKTNRTLSILIITSGMLIIIGGITMGIKFAQEEFSVQQSTDELQVAEEKSYEPKLFEIGTLLSLGGLQILLGIKRMTESRKTSSLK